MELMDVVLQRVVHDSRGVVRDEVIVRSSGETWELEEGRIAEDQFLREARLPRPFVWREVVVDVPVVTLLVFVEVCDRS